MFDLKIINGMIADGTGEKMFRADIGITDERIVQIGDLHDRQSGKTIDAAGKIVAPGFIDMHTHSDLSVIYDRHAPSKVHDGVTTEVIGNCGIGVAPVKADKKQMLIDYLGTRMIGTIPVKLELPWQTCAEYFDFVETQAPAVNVVPLLAHGAIRIAAMGFDKRKPTAAELAEMKDYIRQAMTEGTVGMSSGLIYLPGEYADTEELIELCKTVAECGGIYTTHIRNENEGVFEALEEALTIGEKSQAPVHISHLKLNSPQVWGRADELLARIEKANRDGHETTFDVYPYTAGFTSLSSALPPWVFEGGVEKMMARIQDPVMREKVIADMKAGSPGRKLYSLENRIWNRIVVATVMREESRHIEGMSIQEIATERGYDDPYALVLDLLIEEGGRVLIVHHTMSEADLQKILCHPASIVISDAMGLSTEGLLSYGKPHPRTFGTRARVFAKYVKELGVLSYEEAVKKMTYLPAKRLGLKQRGQLSEGFFADIVVINPETVQDMATYENPKQYSIGFDQVIVNGRLVLDGKRQLEAYPGKVIRKEQ